MVQGKDEGEGEQPGLVRPGKITQLFKLLSRSTCHDHPMYFGLQSNYDKMKSEVPKYKMITPSILADRLRVGSLRRCGAVLVALQ